jgi:hypothetical protein
MEVETCAHWWGAAYVANDVPSIDHFGGDSGPTCELERRKLAVDQLAFLQRPKKPKETVKCRAPTANRVESAHLACDPLGVFHSGHFGRFENV